MKILNELKNGLITFLKRILEISLLKQLEGASVNPTYIKKIILLATY